ncbi:MAG: HD domain-containing protein [Planctomycetota bacterium]
MPERPYIRDLQANQYTDGVFAIQNAQLGKTKNGKPFLKALIADKTGRTPARMWSITEDHFATLPTDGFVWLAGQTQPYQGEMQIIVQEIRAHEPSDHELKDLLPSTEHDIDQMFGEVLSLLQSLEHPAIKSLADRYLEDGELMGRFCHAPAAVTLHHAYLGGLLEHTLGLMKAADALLPLYPKLSRDVVLMGLFLHDLGKCHELSWLQGFQYTRDGQLVGHIGRGAILLETKAQACQDPELGEAALKVPDAILQVLTHIIFSHHGIPEYGALKTPATPEAIFVANLDNLDAKMNMALAEARPTHPKSAATGPAGEAEFTEKIWALDTKLYKPDPTTVPDA